MEKLKALLLLYALPIIVMLIVAFTKDVAVNGEGISWHSRAIAGFIIGMMCDGFIITIAVTWKIITDREFTNDKTTTH